MYKDKNGFKYSTEEIEDAIKGSSLSFDQYVKARGLAIDRNLDVLPSQIERSRYISTLDKPLLGNVSGDHPAQIEHADEGGFLEAAAYSFGGGFLGITEGQETRVVNYLKESYSQYDNVTFKEEDGMDDTVGVYVDDKLVNEVFENIEKDGYRSAFKEGDIVKSMNKTFEGTGHTAVEAEGMRDAVKITNKHGVSRTFSLAWEKDNVWGAETYHSKIKEFLFKLK